MATRDLRFNIFANDRASAAFARASAAAEALANRITRLDGKRARVRIEADTSQVEQKLARAQAELDRLERRKASATIDADIKLFQAKIAKAEADLADLSDEEASPEVDLAIAKAEADIARFREKLEELDRQKASPEVDAKIAQAQAKVQELEEELDYLEKNGTEVEVRADTRDVEAKIAQVQEKLRELERYKPDIEIDAETAAADAKIEQLQDELRQLAQNRTRPEVDLQIQGAQARLEQLEDQLRRLGSRESSPTVTLQTALVTGQIAQVRAQLAALDAENVRPEVELEITRVQGEIAAVRERLRELDGLRITPRIQLDIDNATTRLALLQAQLAAIRDRTVRLRLDEQFGRGANSLLGYLNDLRRAFQNNLNSAAQLMRNVRQLFLPISTAGLLPTLASLGASFRDMAGAIALLPAAAAFAGTAIATLSFAFNGLADAIGPRDTAAQIKKADLAMSRLGESAKEVAKQVIDFKDEWNDLKGAVQDAALADMGLVLKLMGERYIPILETGFVKMGTAFNGVGKNLASFMMEAQQMDDVQRLFSNFSLTVEKLGPGFENVLAAFLDLSVVGSEFLPGLAQGFTNVTGRFRDFIQTARDDGSLKLWMAQGIVAIEEFGDLLGNIGGIFGATFDAAQKSGASFVETMTVATGALEEFLRSGQGQAGMISLFQGIREAIDAMLPGLKVFLGAIADGLGNLQPAFTSVGTAFTALSNALSPTIPLLASLFTDIVGPLSQAFVFLADSVGGVVPMVITLAVAFKGFGAVAAIFLGIGKAISGIATATGLAVLAMSGLNSSGAAATRVTDGMTKLGGAIQRVSASLPLIGAALVAGWMIWDASKSKADEYATSVTRGAMTTSEAIAKEIEQLESRDFWLAQSKEYEAAGDANRRAEATRNVTAALAAQLGQMGPLERAQSEVNIAEANYLDLQKRFGETNPQTVTALGILQSARGRLTTETERHTRVVMTDTEALLANTDAVAGAANADLALERANLNLREQQERTTAVLRDHTGASAEGQRATLDLRQAYLDAAQAAANKAQKDAEARGEADAAAQGARAYRDRLIELASTSDGEVRAALVTMIANLDSTKRGENDAMIAAAGLTEEIKRVPTQQTTTISTPGMEAALTGLQNLTAAVGGLKDKTFKIKADGEVVGVGMTGLATGGILPGYTPGQDVHLAALSGGEAVMRPEWTRAVGSDYIYAGNAVARAGGVGAVRQWLQQGAPTGARGSNPQQLHEYADGGVVNRKVTGNVEYSWPPPTVTNWYDNVVSKFQANVQKAAKAQIATATAAMGGGSGGGGWQWQMNVLRAAFPGLQLISGFRPGSITATGNRSYHAQGRAVDIPPRMDVFNWIKGNYGANSKEIIYSPANGGQVWNGKPHMYSEPTRGDHWDHVHWAFDRGGEARGRGFMFKDVIKPERILSPKMTEMFDRLVDNFQKNGQSNWDGRQLPYATPLPAGASRPRPRPVNNIRLNLEPLLREFMALRNELSTRPQQVLNQTIQGARDPVETGYAAALAMKMKRM